MKVAQCLERRLWADWFNGKIPFLVQKSTETMSSGKKRLNKIERILLKSFSDEQNRGWGWVPTV